MVKITNNYWIGSICPGYHRLRDARPDEKKRRRVSFSDELKVKYICQETREWIEEKEALALKGMKRVKNKKKRVSNK